MRTENPTKQISTPTEMAWLLMAEGDISMNKNGSTKKTTDPLSSFVTTVLYVIMDWQE